MKLLLSSILSIILVVSVGSAYAYDGRITGSTDKSQYFQGDIAIFTGHIIRADPIPDEKVQIIFVERTTGNTVLTTETEIDFPSKIITDDEYWTFEYILDTGNTILMPGILYDVTFTYDDKTAGSDFDFNIPLAEQSSRIPEALINVNDQKIADLSERVESLETKNTDLLIQNEGLKNQISGLNDRIDGLMLIVQEQINTMMKFFQ